MRKSLFLIIFLICLFFVKSKVFAISVYSNQAQIKENSTKILNLEKDLNLVDERISDLKENNNSLYNGIKDQNQILGNQISFTNYILGGFSLLVTIGGILLGVYIQKQYKKIKTTNSIIQKTKDFIDGHSTDLYEKLKKEEMLSLCKRLEEVPEDIANIGQFLLAKDLPEECFCFIKNAYQKAESMKEAPVDLSFYMIIILQNFTYISLNDEYLSSKIIESINRSYINGMFDRDIEKLFKDILRYTKECGLEDENVKNIIKNLMNGLYQSRHEKKKTDLLNLIQGANINSQIFYKIASENRSSDTTYLEWMNNFNK
jgi:hypothetical protein